MDTHNGPPQLMQYKTRTICRKLKRLANTTNGLIKIGRRNKSGATWTTLSRKGVHIGNTLQIRQGRPHTTLCAKHQGKYGEQQNNVGEFQGSGIIALLFIIFLGNMMEGYQALNQDETPRRKTIRRQPETGNLQLAKQIQEQAHQLTKAETQEHIIGCDSRVQKQHTFICKTHIIHKSAPRDIGNIKSQLTQLYNKNIIPRNKIPPRKKI